VEPDQLEWDRTELDPVEPPRPAGLVARAPRWDASNLRRPRVVTAVVCAGAAVVLLGLGTGWVADAGRLSFGRGSAAADVDAAGAAVADRAAAVKAAAERAARRRAAADEARARQVAAAQAADTRAAAERAARAEAEQLARARPQAVVMPALVGLRLDRAMDVAANAGLTDVTVCRTPHGDTPLWWSNWHITGQGVPAGRRIDVDRQVCLSAMKR
jgi:hypothetical protein